HGCRVHTPNDPGLSWLSPMRSRRRFREPMSRERGGQERPEAAGKGAGLSSPLLAPPRRRPRWSEAGVKCCPARWGTQPPPSAAVPLPAGLCSSPGQLPASAPPLRSHEEDDRKVRRREKNRVAAQRSRKKQTQKADKLHEEYESLEQENTSLKREIGKLTDEMKHLSEVLKDHEKICPLLHCTMNFMTIPRPDALASCLPR
ncbi:hypothetical protein Nmel_003882, partial [Mimus melanotis]